MSDSHSPRLLLAIESTCDETAAAIIDDDLKVLSSVIASQANLHERYGGVVPEIASMDTSPPFQSLENSIA